MMLRFAIVDGEKVEAKKGIRGACPHCGGEVIAKCGQVRIHHWAHKKGQSCDPWLAVQTEWHLNWKDEFPEAWQEISCADPKSGERHIADVKTPHGFVIEFQYSAIKPEEVQSREAFYNRMIWVVNGWRRDGDRSRLPEAWDRVSPMEQASKVRMISTAGEPLLRDWAGSSKHVFFDFRDRTGAGSWEMLWWMSPRSDRDRAFVAPFPRARFVENHLQAPESRGADRGSFWREYVVRVDQFIRKLDCERSRVGQSIGQLPLDDRPVVSDRVDLHAFFSPEEVADAKDLRRFLRLDR